MASILVYVGGIVAPWLNNIVEVNLDTILNYTPYVFVVCVIGLIHVAFITLSD